MKYSAIAKVYGSFARGLLACEGKLIHLVFNKAQARSSLSEANPKRNYLVITMIYEELVKQYHSLISDSRLKALSIRNLKIIDSTTIQLFSELLRGVGRNRLDGGCKKGGIKVHAMMDAFSGVTEFVRISEAREHDRSFLYHLKIPAGSWLVFHKAYNAYHQFAKWNKQQVWFVTRMKDNADFHVTKVLKDSIKKKNAKGILKDQYIPKH